MTPRGMWSDWYECDGCGHPVPYHYVRTDLIDISVGSVGPPRGQRGEVVGMAQTCDLYCQEEWIRETRGIEDFADYPTLRTTSEHKVRSGTTNPTPGDFDLFYVDDTREKRRRDRDEHCFDCGVPSGQAGVIEHENEYLCSDCLFDRMDTDEWREEFVPL